MSTHRIACRASLPLIIASFALSACASTGGANREAAPTPSPEIEAAANSKELPPEDANVDQNPLAAAWARIWMRRDPLHALREFKDKHGVFIETTERKGELSVLAQDAPNCEETFMSLVKNTRAATHTVREIRPSGKRVQDWNIGAGTPIGMSPRSIFQKVEFYENPSDYAASKTGSRTLTHAFVLRINSDDSYEILPANAEPDHKWEVAEVPCPLNDGIKSEHYSCVKDKHTERLFVLQRPCS